MFKINNLKINSFNKKIIEIKKINKTNNILFNSILIRNKSTGIILKL